MSIDFTNKKQISENNLIDFQNDIDIGSTGQVVVGFIVVRTFLRWGVGLTLLPGDELLLTDGVGVGGVVGKDGVGLGCHVAINDNFAGASVKVGGAGGIDRAADDVVAKVLEVVSQQVVGIHLQVEGEV